MLIKEFENLLGSQFSDEEFFVASVTENTRTKNGKRWAVVELRDTAHDVLHCKMWSEDLKEEYLRFGGKVCKVSGRVEIYDSRTSVIVTSMEISDSRVEPYIDSLPKDTVAKAYTAIKGLIAGVTNVPYRRLLEEVYFSKDGLLSRSLAFPGGQEHHAYAGGVLIHSIECCNIALSIMQNMGFYQEVASDKDLIIAGALLHDIGKISLYEPINNVKNKRGYLINGGSESVYMVTQFSNRIPPEHRVTDMTELFHIILACSKENKPQTREALIVRQADSTSSFISGFDAAEDGEYFSMLETVIFK